MTQPDEFNPQIDFAFVLYTAILGLALGLVIAGVALAIRSERRKAGVALVGIGAALGLVTGFMAFDAGPAQVLDFQLKPFLAELAEAAALAAAGVLGTAVAAVVVLRASRAPGKVPLLAATAGVLVGAGIGMYALTWHSSEGTARHPKGTDRSGMLQATRIIDGLGTATGLDIAGNGDLAVVELLSARFLLYRPSGAAFELKVEGRIPVGEGHPGLHVAFHPDYPAVPVVFVTAENGEGSGGAAFLFRGDLSEGSVAFEQVAGPFPSTTLADGGVHFGGGLTACGDSLFVSTSDGETKLAQEQDFDSGETVRQSAQQLDSAAGKVLRWHLRGAQISPEPIAGSAFPIFALGFRNPFGIDCDSISGALFVAENGHDGHDQVRLVRPGSNHEWPLSDARNQYEPPLFDSGATRMAPTDIAVRTTESGARELIFTTFASEGIYALPLGDDGSVGRLRLLREVDGGAFGLAVDSAGCAFFSDSTSVWRLDEDRCTP